MKQSDRKILAKLRRLDTRLLSPRASVFRSPKQYRRKPKHKASW